jgi:alpha-glucosidase
MSQPDPLLDAAHHDGSPLYLDDEQPALGAHVGVWVRTSRRTTPDAVWVRTVEDGEPFYAELTVQDRPERPDGVWWRGVVHVRNPVERYRFLLVSGDEPSWLTQSGVHDRDVPDAEDFVVTTHAPAPAWARDAVIYQIFPDRFARSAAANDRPVPAWAVAAAWDDAPIHQGPDTPLQFYGGDLDGIVEHLDHVVATGADTVYLTPVFPGESNHRYNASTFDEVDPMLGGDAAYRRLIDACHEHGLRVLGDFTSNHTGDTHEWFIRARSDATSVERGFYYFDEHGSYEGWKGYDTLPKLDHRNAELGERVRAVVARWLEFGLDGWRIDVANMTGRHVDLDIAHDVARSLRRTVESVRPDGSIVGEHGHDASGDLDGDGWHGTMNYYGFSFPVWQFVRRSDGPVANFGLPIGQPRRDALRAFGTMRSFVARFGWRAVEQSWNILGSHDTPRIRTVAGSVALHHVAIALQFTLPGVPMVFAGDEFGLEGVNGEDARRTIAWGTDLPTETLAVYQEYADLRRAHPALRRGSVRWLHLGEDLAVYVREHPDGDVLVACSRGTTAALDLGAPYGEVPAFDAPGVHVVIVG